MSTGVFRQAWIPQTQKPLNPVFTATVLGTPNPQNTAAIRCRESQEFRLPWTQGKLSPLFTGVTPSTVPLRAGIAQPAREERWRVQNLIPEFPFFSDELVVVPGPPLTGALLREAPFIQLPRPKAIPQFVSYTYTARDTRPVRTRDAYEWRAGQLSPPLNPVFTAVAVSTVPPMVVVARAHSALRDFGYALQLSRLRQSAVSGSDATPDSFLFTDQTGVAISSTITSAAVTIAGINAAAAITVTGGTYDINGSGTFTSSAGTVNNGDTIRARHTSSGSYNTATDTVVTVGGVSDTFTSTTRTEPAGGGGGTHQQHRGGMMVFG